jgi:hypothetical protein
VSRSFGRDSCTGPAVVLTVTSRYPFREPGAGRPHTPRPAGSGPGQGTR